MEISKTGCWQCDTKDQHMFDESLADAILKQLLGWGVTEVKDFGCGPGAYVDYFRAHGLHALGYDGNPNTNNFSDSCHVVDLSKRVELGPVVAVISLEVGEHIPEEYEDTFIDNLVRHAERYLVLSWFPRKGHGTGHVNERSNEYVIEKLAARGFKPVPEITIRLRDAATLWWFKESLMAFVRE
jgi:hypothetical protein